MYVYRPVPHGHDHLCLPGVRYLALARQPALRTLRYDATCMRSLTCVRPGPALRVTALSCL